MDDEYTGTFTDELPGLFTPVPIRLNLMIYMAEEKMPENAKQKLIVISGSPCVGKTTVATSLFESYENSAYCDGDWMWCVNPFSVNDPRLRNGDKNMSFVIIVGIGFQPQPFKGYLIIIDAFSMPKIGSLIDSYITTTEEKIT